MSNRVVSQTFRHIIDDVIANVRQDFEDMGIEKEVLEELQRSWEAKLVATQVAEFEGASVPSIANTLGYGGAPLVPTPAPAPTPAAKPKDEPADDAQGTKRKRTDKEDSDDDEIGSDLDDSDEDEGDGNEDMVLCLYDKVQRVKNKWKCVLRDGIASINGRDYLFSKCNGCVCLLTANSSGSLCALIRTPSARARARARTPPRALHALHVAAPPHLLSHVAHTRQTPPVTCDSVPPPAPLIHIPMSGQSGQGSAPLRAVRSVLSFDNVRTAALVYVVVVFGRVWLRALSVHGPTGLALIAYRRVVAFVIGLVLRLPANRRRLEREMDQAMGEIESSLMPPTSVPTQRELPAYGRTAPWIEAQLAALQHLGSKGDADGTSVWRDGRCSGAVYHGGDDLSELIASTISRFLLSNPLHPEVFPGLRKMEAEVVAMVLSMYNAPAGAAGATTSGGTESILMACKAMRDWGRAERGITHPEIVIPASAHVAFDKAGHYFGMTVRRVPVDPETRKVRTDLVARTITSDTVLLVGSAPNFPDGIIDDIVALGQLARRYRIGLHVDCCLGSFLVPFLERAGYASEPFDFRVDGVTSISCDTHKYGFAPKGSSVIMYRSAALRKYQYFVATDWAGGVYASPTLAGSRPGALIAGTWATMVRLGADGYTESCREIVGAAKRIERAVREDIPELTVLGRPLVSVVAIASAGHVNIYDVGDHMSRRGWHLNAIAGDRPAVHIACTRLTVPVVGEFVADLKAAAALSRERSTKPGTMATVYGMSSTTPVAPYVIGEMASRFIDAMYKVA